MLFDGLAHFVLQTNQECDQFTLSLPTGRIMEAYWMMLHSLRNGMSDNERQNRKIEGGLTFFL